MNFWTRNWILLQCVVLGSRSQKNRSSAFRNKCKIRHENDLCTQMNRVYQKRVHYLARSENATLCERRRKSGLIFIIFCWGDHALDHFDHFWQKRSMPLEKISWLLQLQMRHLYSVEKRKSYNKVRILENRNHPNNVGIFSSHGPFRSI